MSYTYLQDAGAESSAASFSDITLFAPLKSNHTAAACSCNGSGMACCHASPCGMTCEPSTVGLGGGGLMSSAEASRVRTSQSLERPQALMAGEAGCGEKWPESLATLRPDGSLWRTRQCLLFEDSDESLETWPEWGFTRGMEFWAATQPGAVRTESESGYSLMRPIASDGLRHRFKLESLIRKGHQDGNLSEQLARVHRKKLTPLASEILMGWPEMWTDCAPLETGNVRNWLHSHGAC